MTEKQIMLVSAAVLVLIAYVGFRLLKSLLKGLMLGIGIALGVAAAWHFGLLPRETPSVVERTGKTIDKNVERLGEAVTEGAKGAFSEAKKTTQKVGRATTKAVKDVTNEVGAVVGVTKKSVEASSSTTGE
jgi:gas vesicle protein